VTSLCTTATAITTVSTAAYTATGTVVVATAVSNCVLLLHSPLLLDALKHGTAILSTIVLHGRTSAAYFTLIVHYCCSLLLCYDNYLVTTSNRCGRANARGLSGFAGVGDLTSSGVKLNNQTANALRAELLRANAGPKGGAAAGRVEVSNACYSMLFDIVLSSILSV
jgi:hypothetical protein